MILALVEHPPDITGLLAFGVLALLIICIWRCP